MKTRLAILLLAATLTATAHASKTILPDACGKDEVKFDIETTKDVPPPAGPEADKAQIIFIAKIDKGMGYPIVRFGIDGAWVGATRDSGYFAVSVAPGEHHLCEHKHPQFGLNLEPGVATLTAEAGKTYYYEFSVTKIVSGGSGGFVAGGPSAGQPVIGGAHVTGSPNFGPVTEDEGKYRLKISPLSISAPKK
jgi:hypothetical protein